MLMEVAISNKLIEESGLNPHAAPFVPSAYRAVEDFSDEWWRLVHASPCFRDYWLRERYVDYCEEDEEEEEEAMWDLPDLESKLDELLGFAAEGEVMRSDRGVGKELMARGAEKWLARAGRVDREIARYFEKAPKVVSLKVRPRSIQQPR